jgi:hypothetical protein
LERQLLGTTNLPMDVVEEYLDSVRPVFTAEVCNSGLGFILAILHQLILLGI